MAGWAPGGLAVAIWLYLTLLHGRFWRTSIRLPPAGPAPPRWPSVTVVIPARDEAAVLPLTLPALLGQQYPGRLRVLVVDDDSSDRTGELAAAAGAELVRTAGPPPGWAGKVAAMAAGVAAAGEADYLLFTDADIAFPPGAVERLVRCALGNGLDLTSQMVRLRAASGWERVLVPAFVYFFAQLYPFARVNDPARRTAAAAGGCMLVRCAALAAAGGLAGIRGAVIDDVALGRLLKRHGRIWLGLSGEIESIRPYPTLGELWRMVARSAYTQLRHSPLLLAGTVVGLLACYLLAPALTLAGAVAAEPALAVPGAIAWVLMAASYLPMLRHYRRAGLWAPALPLVALLYLGMTLDSARRHRAGRGAAWKGRVAARGTRPG